MVKGGIMGDKKIILIVRSYDENQNNKEVVGHLRMNETDVHKELKNIKKAGKEIVNLILIYEQDTKIIREKEEFE